AELEQRNAELEAKLRLREQQLFGKKSEAGAAKSEAVTTPSPTPKKPRGQQPGQPGPPRRDHSHLPAVQEVLELPKDQQCCPCSGVAFGASPGEKDAEALGGGAKATRGVPPRPPLPPRLFVKRPPRHHPRPAGAPGDPQGHPGRLHLGRGLARQVPLLPP